MNMRRMFCALEDRHYVSAFVVGYSRNQRWSSMSFLWPQTSSSQKFHQWQLCFFDQYLAAFSQTWLQPLLSECRNTVTAMLVIQNMFNVKIWNLESSSSVLNFHDPAEFQPFELFVCAFLCRKARDHPLWWLRYGESRRGDGLMAPGAPSASKAAGELGELERILWCIGNQPLLNTVDGSEFRLTGWHGNFPILYRVLYIPGGCLGFLPSTVSSWLDGHGDVVHWPATAINSSRL